MRRRTLTLRGSPHGRLARPSARAGADVGGRTIPCCARSGSTAWWSRTPCASHRRSWTRSVRASPARRQYDGSVDWACRVLRSWGVDARAEQYGTWNGWRGASRTSTWSAARAHARGHDARLEPGHGWAPGRGARRGDPEFATPAEFEAWLPSVRGRFVAISFPQPTCRPLSHYEQFGQVGRGFGGFGGGGGRPGVRRRNAAAAAGARTARRRRATIGRCGCAWRRPAPSGILESYWSNDSA
jgi:hypothetical protein